MSQVPKQVVIVDNATTCSMRIKILVNMHGGDANLIHWGSWEEAAPHVHPADVCLLIIEQSVPVLLAENLLKVFEHIPTFVLLNDSSPAPSWSLNHQVSPLLTTLSSHETVSIIEPYWSHDSAMVMPKTLLVAEQSEVVTNFSRFLSDNLINFQLQTQLQLDLALEIDMVLYHVEDVARGVEELAAIRQQYPSAGILLFAKQHMLTQLPLIHALVDNHVDKVFTADELNNQWQGQFLAIWYKALQRQEDNLLINKAQQSLDNLLEKNLIMQVLFATASDGVLAFDEYGKVIRFNEGFCELVGVMQQQVNKTSIDKWFSKQSLLKVRDIVNATHWVQQQTSELELIHEHNVKISVSAAINKINSKGQYIYIAILRNITNQQLQTKLLLHKNAQLEHYVKEANRQKDLLTDIWTKGRHKRNLFMQKLMAYIYSQLDNPIDDKTVLARKISHIEWYYRLITKKEFPTIEFIELDTELGKALEDYSERLTSRGIDVEVNVPNDCSLQCSKAHFGKIITELVENVLLFSQSNSVLTIELAEESEQFVDVRITDVGQGIYEQKQLNIFDLYDLNNVNSDDQLATSLPLIHELMHINGGEVYVEDSIKQDKIVGTTFTLRFIK